MRLAKFTLLLSAFIFLLSTSIVAQEQLVHKKKMYFSPEGKLFINKDLPMYFRVSSSPNEDAESFLLMPTADSKKYANPAYLDTEGYNTFRSPSKVDTVTKKTVYPLDDIKWEVYADSRSPITHFEFDNKKYYKNENIFYFGEKIHVKFRVTDATSGVEKTYYSINGQAYKELSTDVELNEEKLYEIKYYSVDFVGNVETPKSINIKIDLTKPVTKLTVKPDLFNDIISVRSKIILEASDENSKIKKTVFSINNGTYYNYQKPIVISGLSEGEHTIAYYSTDNTNNEEPEKTYTFYLDKTPPMVVDELIGNTFIANGKEYSSGRSKVKLTAMDNKAGVHEIRYSINDGEFLEYTKPFFLSKSGKLKIQAFVTDKVNNQVIKTILTSKSSISYVDLSGPTLGHRFTGANFISKDTAFITKDTKIILSARDNASGAKRKEYSIDNGEIIDYTASFSVNKEGIHSITYTGYDNVDNSSTNTFICVEDNIGPEIFFRFSIPSEKTKSVDEKNYSIYPNHVVLFLSSTDKSVGFDKLLYSVNGAPNKTYTSLITGFQKEKAYSITVTAIDKLGNKSQNTIEFYIE
jgi:hypothetical protein